MTNDLAIALRLSRGEQLDCVGLTKRLGEKQNFPSVSRVAADPWIRGLSPEDARDLNSECRKLGEKVLGSIDRECYTKFPFEGTAVYRSRYPEIEEERGAQEELRALAQTLKRLEKSYGIPDPYLTVLMADGDRMGEYISGIESPERHRQFSLQLAQFAKDTRTIVDGHNGCLVYAGGDDVLAFLPVDQALTCARALHDRFNKLLPEASLSVGIAIGHFMEPLEDLLSYAREAERASKHPDRNGLAVHVHPHSGAPFKMRRSWTTDPDRRLAQWSRLLREEMISSKAAYAVHELAADYRNWPGAIVPRQTIVKDLTRLLSRKKLTEEARSKLHEELSVAVGGEGLNALGEELLVARRISIAEGQAQGPRE